MVIFIELVQYAKNLGRKSWKNLVEHQIINNDKMIQSMQHLFTLLAPQNLNRETLKLFGRRDNAIY